ncbi:MAG TPA: hypothetical protein VGI97_14830 [Gemmatimonadaceae bacterium]|jgi:hypothetical protein
MTQNEQGKVVGSIPNASDQPPAEHETPAGMTVPVTGESRPFPRPMGVLKPLAMPCFGCKHLRAEHEQVATGGKKKCNVESCACESFVEVPARDQLRTLPVRLVAEVFIQVHRFANWIRLNLCNTLGITYAMRELNNRGAGTRLDLDRVAETTMHNAELLKRCIEQLNKNTRLVQAWREGYPILGKIAAELEARDAKNAKKVVTNGKMAHGIVGPDGRAIGNDRLDRLLEYVTENFRLALENRGRLIEPKLGELFRGEPLTEAEVNAALLCQKSLLEAARKPPES